MSTFPPDDRQRQLDQYHDSGNPFEPPPPDEEEKPDPLPIAKPTEPVHTLVTANEMLAAVWLTINKYVLQHLAFGAVLLLCIMLVYIPLLGFFISIDPDLPFNLPQDLEIPLAIGCGVLTFLACVFWLPGIMMGAIKRGLYVARGGKGRYGMIFQGFRYWWKGFALGIIVWLISALPGLLMGSGVAVLLQLIPRVGDTFFPLILALLILSYLLMFVLWLFVAAKFAWSFFFVVDREMGVFESLAASWEFSKGNVPGIIGGGMLAAIIPIVTLYCCYIGTIIGPSVFVVAYSMMYLKITGQPNVHFNPEIHTDQW